MTTKRELTLDEIAAARGRADERNRIEPRADRVDYDQKKGHIVLHLRGGAILALPVSTIRELRDVEPKELRAIRAGFGGESISLDALDIDISIPGLLRDLVGMTSAAALLGRAGGAATSDAKTAAVRENGKRGGRPRKAPQLA
jgi:protein involved in temperature-dependent protein secretion